MLATMTSEVQKKDPITRVKFLVGPTTSPILDEEKQVENQTKQVSSTSIME